MIVRKKALSRRAVLKGLGVTITLPLLDSMVPAMTALAKTAANELRTSVDIACVTVEERGNQITRVLCIVFC